MKKIIFSVLVLFVFPLYASAFDFENNSCGTEEFFASSPQENLICGYDPFGPENNRRHIEIYETSSNEYAHEYYIYEVYDSPEDSSKKYHLLLCGYHDEDKSPLIQVDFLPKSIAATFYELEDWPGNYYSTGLQDFDSTELQANAQTDNPIGILYNVNLNGKGNCFAFAGVKQEPETGVDLFAYSDVSVSLYFENGDCTDNDCLAGNESNMGAMSLAAEGREAIEYDDVDSWLIRLLKGHIDVRKDNYSTSVGEKGDCITLLGSYDDNHKFTFAWYLHTTLKFVKYLAPTLVILFSSIDYISATASSDADAMKKANSKLIKRIICCVLLFFIPIILNLILNIFKVYGTCQL